MIIWLLQYAQDIRYSLRSILRKQATKKQFYTFIGITIKSFSSMASSSERINN